MRYISFGCRVNSVELNSIRYELQKRGLLPCPEDTPPDICIVNTCSVTSVAESKQRRKLRALARRYPNVRIYLLGCYAQMAPHAVSELPNVQGIFDNTKKRKVIEVVTRGLGITEEWFSIHEPLGRSRVPIKVQDGCPGNCSYCIVSPLRGAPVSRPVKDVLAEISRLCDSGVAEIVLTGVNLASWGVERGKRLSELVRAIADLSPAARIRLSSLEPDYIDEGLVSTLADAQEIFCPHFHLPVQSGSDAVLAHMGRNYTVERFMEVVQRILESFPLCGITADVIVGYPTETKRDYERTTELCRRVGFHRIHSFSYSPRPGTRAYALGDGISGDVKRQRAADLQRVAESNLKKLVNRISPRHLEVVFDGPPKPSSMREGYSAEYLHVRSDSFYVPGSSVITVSKYEAKDGEVVMTAPAQ
ncbi:MAG: MiaB/RimO family radical SAM methylthiotransferase [Planctomycetota bacterium]|nr:MiaB/RimO family radical SAM methylthiotransferase [Planctomycetota bacterium]